MAKEIEFHSDLYQELKSLTEEIDKYDNVEIEKTLDSGKRVDIFVKGNLTYSIVIEVKRKSINPLNDDVIQQAREYANELGCQIFVTCNEDTSFIFYQEGDEIEFHDYDYHTIYTKNRDVSYIAESILDVSNSRYSQDKFPNQEERDHALSILSNFQKQFQPSLFDYATNKFSSNEKFRRFIINWCKENGYSEYVSEDEESLDNSEEIIKNYSKQATYILANRLLLYQIVRQKTPNEIKTKSGSPLKPITSDLSSDATLESISDKFELIREEIDYEPIFEQKVFPTDTFYLDKKSQKNFKRLADSLSKVNIDEINSDFLGEIYEELIPPSERKSLGQFYTHPSIAKTICEWATEDTNSVPNMLDPACGSGTFSVEAYNCLKEKYNLDHREAIKNISFVDVNPFALNLTSMNLIGKDLSVAVEDINGFEGSYLDIDSRKEKVKQFGKKFQKPFDAIVGNPPYIKHQSIKNKEAFRSHLENLNIEKSSIPSSSDAYIYFITQSTQFITEGGRVGMIIPNKWMMSDYGEPFLDFLLKFYCIKGVVGFSQLAFSDADVDTTMLLLERNESEVERKNNKIKFMYITDKMDPTDIVDNLQLDYNIESNWSRKSRGSYELTLVKQRHIQESNGSIRPYLYAPTESIIEIYESSNLVNMKKFISFRRGESPGATKFFFIEEEDVNKYNLSEELLTPAFRSPKYIDSPKPDKTNWYILDVHQYIESIRDVCPEEKLEKDWVLEQMKADGYDSTVKYIKQAEQKDMNSSNTCQDREIWFNLGNLEKYQKDCLYHPRNFHKDLYTIKFKKDTVPSDTFYLMSIDESLDIDETVIHAIMNTNLYKLLLEIGGRTSGGGALRTFGTDLKDLPFPNLSELKKDDLKKIKEHSENQEYGEVEKVLVDSLGLDLTSEKIAEDFKLLNSNRTGKDSEVLTDTDNISL